MHVGQAVTSPLVLEYKLLVINPHQMHDGSLKIMHMHRIFDDIIAKIIGLTVHKSFFHARTSHPDGETARMVVAAVVIAGELTL